MSVLIDTRSNAVYMCETVYLPLSSGVADTAWEPRNRIIAAKGKFIFLTRVNRKVINVNKI